MDGDYPSQDARKLFYDRAAARAARATPSSRRSALTNRFRMVFSGNGPIEIDGKIYKDKRDRPHANFEQVTGGFFDVTGQRLLEGRTFTDDDLDSRQPVAIVNAAFARKHFGGESAIGRRFRTVDAQRHAARAVAHDRRRGRRPSACSGRSTIRRRRHRLLRAVLLDRRSARRRRRRSSASSRRSSSSRAAVSGPTRSSTRCGARCTRPIRTCRCTSSARRSSQLDGFIAQNRIIAIMFSIFGAVAVCSRRSVFMA